MPVRKIQRQKRPTIETAADYESAWLQARYFEANGKWLERAEFHARTFDSPRELKAFYEANRADFSKLQEAGERHCLWWLCDSPEPRDEEIEQAEQLDRLGLLTSEEIEVLRTAAEKANEVLHKSPWHNGRFFHRRWGYWRFLSPEPRDPSVAECVQLRRLGVLTSLEKELLADPEKRFGNNGRLADLLLKNAAGDFVAAREIFDL